MATTEIDDEISKTELRKVNNHRHSNESGILVLLQIVVLEKNMLLSAIVNVGAS